MPTSKKFASLEATLVQNSADPVTQWLSDRCKRIATGVAYKKYATGGSGGSDKISYG